MAAGLVYHDITTAAGVTFKVASWVPNTAAPDVGGVPVAFLTDGTSMAAIGPGPRANALRVEYASDGNVITVAQGASSGGVWAVQGTPGGTLLPVTIDPSQLNALITGAVPVISGGYDWEFVGANITDELLGATVTGSYLEHLMCIVTTPATSHVNIKDGSGGTARTILPDSVAGGIGTYILPIGILSKAGGWFVSTGAGVTVLATFHV
jgi:hypothetical protein